MTQIFRIGASPQTQPKDVRISDISDNSATVSWTTDGQTTDFLVWGTTQNSISNVVNDDSTNQKYYTHLITISGLTANTTYYFKINSEGNTYDNNGLPWQFSTGPNLGANTATFPVSGSVINASGSPEKRAIVYLNTGGYMQAVLTSDSGNYIVQLGNARSSDLQSYVQIDPKTTLLQISVQAGADGISSAQIYPQSAQPVPPIVIGQVYDFRNLGPNTSGQNPAVNLQLPENSTQSSKFNTSVTGTPSPGSVILENITEGEVISSDQPQFLGKGPGGGQITITVHSQVPITENLTIPKNGSWSWSPPTALDPGQHSITITWVDSLGITRSLTRDFTVQASELPAFTASESGTTPTPIPTETALPSESAIPNETPIPTLSPTPVPTATVAPVPVTGDLTPTILLSMMGLAVIAFSFVVWKSSDI